MGGPRRRARARASAVALGLLATLAAAGCVSPGETPADGGSATGAWQLRGAGCTQHLVLGAGSTFRLGSDFSLEGFFWRSAVAGTVAAAGADTVTFAPAGRVSPGGLVYCGQWARAVQTPLPEADLQTRTGLTFADLAFRSFITPALGRVLVGTDTARDARLLLFREPDGPLRGVLPRAGRPLARPDDPVRTLTHVNGHATVPVPGGFYEREFAAADPGTLKARLVLVLVGAARVTFAGEGDDLAGCDYVVHGDLLFGAPVAPAPLESGVASQTLEVNPALPAAYLFPYVIPGTEPPATAYLLPVAVQSPSEGACRARITAEPLVLAELAEDLPTDSEDEAFAVVLPLGDAALLPLAAPPDGPLRLMPLAPGEVHAQDARLAPQVVTLGGLAPSPGAEGPVRDPLGLAADAPPAVRVSVGRDAAGTALNLFPADGGTASLGPFLRYAPAPAPAATLAAPEGTLTGLAATKGERLAFTVPLAAPARVAIGSAGGVPLRARLLDATGVTLAEASGGAPAGDGFLLLRTLAAGSYRLEVWAQGTGTFDLAAELVPDGGFADEALEGCLVAAGWAQPPPAEVDRLDCPRRDVADLAGLEQATGLRFADLSDNRVTDVTALAGLVALESLSLARNPVADVSPLAALPLLRELSLAEAPLDPTKLASLSALADTLAYLDLRGVTTISGADVAALRAALPNTVLVAPDGTVMPPGP